MLCLHTQKISVILSLKLLVTRQQLRQIHNMDDLA